MCSADAASSHHADDGSQRTNTDDGCRLRMMPATDDADDGSRRPKPTTGADDGCRLRMPTTDAHDGCRPRTTAYDAFDAAEQVDAADEVRAMASRRRGPRS